MWGQSPHLKGGAGAKPPSFGCSCAYIGGRRGISVAIILPTQNHCWVVLRDYLILIYLVLWFFALFWVIFDAKTAKIETELSPTFTNNFGYQLSLTCYFYCLLFLMILEHKKSTIISLQNGIKFNI